MSVQRASNTSLSAAVASSSSSSSLRCACDELQHRCDDVNDRDYCTTNSTCFTAMVRDIDGRDVITMGCIDDDQRSQLNCHVGSQTYVAIKCCNDASFCNRHLLPTYMTDDSSSVNEHHHHDDHDAHVAAGLSDTLVQQMLYVLAGLILFIIVVLVVTWCVLRGRGRRKMALLVTKQQILCSQSHEIDLKVTPIGDSTLQGIYACEQSSTSGSGSGAPLLAQRTVASNIQLHEIIGKGRYGQVWCGSYQGESVAVKIFSSHAESTWWRECAIYSTVMLRHENILAFIAADTVSRVTSNTQLWLVTRYHHLGSLYDFLRHHTIASSVELLRLMESTAAGLTHLHTEIVGTQGKPAIAHRDVKSRNILVMSDRRCCIADLGLAVLQRPPQPGVLPPSCTSLLSVDELNVAAANLKVGTRRCMAPEILDETINVNMFDSYRQADVYSFALVLWEISRRFIISGIVYDYQPPYFDLVPNDPSFDDMKRVVCTSQLRPTLPACWTNNQVMSPLSQLMTECWHAKPTARLTMLRVKKSLSRLLMDDE